MKLLIHLAEVVLLLVSGALAQSDPGIRDTIIVSSMEFEPGTWGLGFSIEVQVWTVTDDSVDSYNLPLTWHAPYGGISPQPGVQYFPPVTRWEQRADTLMLAEELFRMTGRTDSIPGHPLLTDGQRIYCWMITLNVAPDMHSQTVTIDTTYDPLNGSLHYGLRHYGEITPVFVPGRISFIPFWPDTEGVAVTGEMPRDFNLLQNYPNPFNAQTTIEYNLPQSCQAKLEVFDLLGQKLETVLDDFQSAGNHKVIFDASSLSSGIYFYGFRAGEIYETRHFSVIK
jgi:hypothetical protein